RPELYVVPRADQAALATALRKKIDTLQARYPGLSLNQFRQGWRLQIPEQYRVGHEAHFGQVTRQFLRYLKDPKTLPAWEKPTMLAKYFVTTEGGELARRSGGAEASGVA